MKHIIESQQFDRDLLSNIFDIADQLEKRLDASLKGKIIVSLFYEPSTRTRFSFESAAIRLGGSVISTENAKEFSSAAKGETLEDTIKVVSTYADIIVLRHYEQGASQRAASVSRVPIINAGDGIGQHPTQALLDLYTIKKELSKVDNLNVAMVGDLKNGRTVRSLSYLLGKYDNNKITYISPPELKIGQDIKEHLTENGVEFSEDEEMDKVISEIDVLYQTRIQKERFENTLEYEKYKGRYVVTPALVKAMKLNSIVMHPLPRIDEISKEVDVLKNAAYFRQVKYGLFVRMALLKYVLS